MDRQLPWKLYSWKDVDRYCVACHDIWKQTLEQLKVYPSEIVAYRRETDTSIDWNIFEKLFGDHFDRQSCHVRLDISDQEGSLVLPITEEEWQEVYAKPVRPLFREILYRASSYPKPDQLPSLPCNVIAFHSYKGGVGRTLSLLAFAKAWSEEFSQEKRLLIVDADIEAPGISWIQEDRLEDTLSYLDLLTLIQDNTDVDQVVSLACSKLKAASMTIETSTRNVEHIFIPTYRYREQLLDLYASPENIAIGKDKQYILSVVLAKICKQMGLHTVLVDLRAGLSEFSATLLFDPRVKKYLVSSTSTQSIQGTEIILEYLMKGLYVGENTVLPEVFLNMVMETLSKDEKNELINGLIRCYEANSMDTENRGLADNAITELPFASELVHLTSLRQILQNLNGRDLYQKLRKLVQQNYKDSDSTLIKSEAERRRILEKINRFAQEQLSAESNKEFEILMTKPLRELIRKYSDAIPTTVIMGAKGAGKTFLYRKMAEAKNWKSFCKSLNHPSVFHSSSDEYGDFFLPVIATATVNNIIPTLQSCITELNQAIPYAQVNSGVFLTNRESLERRKSEKDGWSQFWEELLTSSISPQWHTFQEANEHLKKSGKKVIFLIDGLEEIFRHVSDEKSERIAVRTLCQEVVTKLIAQYHHLGIVVFLRRDIAQSAITVNFTQFEGTYKNVELQWSSEEALRLAVWLTRKAGVDFHEADVETDVASSDVIERCLEKLWGLKLGRPSSNEAYSSRWILAALSDFNSQLQARDMIRFLAYAAVPGKKDAPYQDRILMPAEIRGAVAACSKEKLGEVKQEYAALKPIFERLDQLSAEVKYLPLDPADAKLSSEEESSMIREGYLKRESDQYYLPEIIRYSLGFKYRSGARPKVIALTLPR